MRLGFGFGRAAGERWSPVTCKSSQVPFRSRNHRCAAALRGLIARAVTDRHLILGRLADVADSARICFRVQQRRMLGRIERAVLRVEATSLTNIFTVGAGRFLGHVRPPESMVAQLSTRLQRRVGCCSYARLPVITTTHQLTPHTVCNLVLITTSSRRGMTSRYFVNLDGRCKSASVARRLFIVKEPCGIDAAEPLLDGRVRLPVFEALFDEATLRQAHLLRFELERGSVRVAAPREAIPESSEHGASLAPPLPARRRAAGGRTGQSASACRTIPPSTK
jgi:hypothetical protein